MGALNVSSAAAALNAAVAAPVKLSADWQRFESNPLRAEFHLTALG